jgi:hypothetical protein
MLMPKTVLPKSVNNAFSTPKDGTSGRMQMFYEYRLEIKPINNSPPYNKVCG